MPPADPPVAGLDRPAHTETLAAATRAWRIHSTRHGATATNLTIPKSGRGGRFDSEDGSYGYIYVGDSPDAAVAETLCRDLRLDDTERVVPKVLLRDKVLTELEVRADITVAALHGPHLAAVGQDTWLTKSEADTYPHTRRWAAAILGATPTATGLAYRCRHNEDRIAWMLTTPPTVTSHPHLGEVPGTALPLDTTAGRSLVARILDDHSAVLSTRC